MGFDAGFECGGLGLLTGCGVLRGHLFAFACRLFFLFSTAFDLFLALGLTDGLGSAKVIFAGLSCGGVLRFAGAYRVRVARCVCMVWKRKESKDERKTYRSKSTHDRSVSFIEVEVFLGFCGF